MKILEFTQAFYISAYYHEFFFFLIGLKGKGEKVSKGTGRTKAKPEAENFIQLFLVHSRALNT